MHISNPRRRRVLRNGFAAILVLTAAVATYRLLLTYWAAQAVVEIRGAYDTDFVPGLGPQYLHFALHIPGVKAASPDKSRIMANVDLWARAFLRLRRVDVSHVGLTSQEATRVVQRMSFSEFVAHDVAIDRKLIDALMEHPELRMLAFDGSQLSYADLQRLRELKELDHLVIHNSPLTASEVAALRAEMPHTRIELKKAYGTGLPQKTTNNRGN